MYLVAKTLGGNDRDFIGDSLVGFEVEGKARVVALDENFGALLDGLNEKSEVYAWESELSGQRLTFVRTRPMMAVACRRSLLNVMQFYVEAWWSEVVVMISKPARLSSAKT